jgi:hypothetical protein
MCQKQEATKYINVCRFKINCADIDKVGNDAAVAHAQETGN